MPEDYRTHVVFVKKIKDKKLADIVFFKHKYITQPTVMPADAIVHAYHKLIQALQGIQNLRDNIHIKALERIKSRLMPSNNPPVKEHKQVTLPRVEQQDKNELTDTVPRVRFEEKEPVANKPPPQLVVAWPKENIVKSKLTLKQPKYIAKSSDSIAA